MPTTTMKYKKSGSSRQGSCSNEKLGIEPSHSLSRWALWLRPSHPMVELDIVAKKSSRRPVSPSLILYGYQRVLVSRDQPTHTRNGLGNQLEEQIES